jgi:hypothetical protein
MSLRPLLHSKQLKLSDLRRGADVLAELEQQATDRVEITLFREALANGERHVKSWKIAVFALIVAWFMSMIGIVTAVFVYLYQYDFGIEATGVYTAVNESGNIVAQDITPEMWKQFQEWAGDE